LLQSLFITPTTDTYNHTKKKTGVAFTAANFVESFVNSSSFQQFMRQFAAYFLGAREFFVSLY